MSAILDVIIGIIFVYTFFSMISSGIAEWIARLFSIRASVLKTSVMQLVSGDQSGSLGKELYEHPMIAGLAYCNSGPTYIPASHFALALMQLAVNFPAPAGPGVPAPNAEANDNVNGGGNAVLTTAEKELINSMVQGLNSAGAVQTRVEKWFEDSMERVSGRYKRRTYWILLAISLAVSLGIGVDSFRIANELYRNNSLRAAVVKRAQAAVDASPDPSKAKISLDGLDIPIGPPASIKATDDHTLGCLITAIALTLGAPFWFDLLGRLVNLRQTGVPPDMKGKIVAQ